jgi:pre-mRNA-splicing factor CDC5/CEF1
VPEDELGADGDARGSRQVVEDQADLDERADTDKEQKRLSELKLRSQVVQRSLPRPSDINTNIMRPSGPNDQPLTELQKVFMFS